MKILLVILCFIILVGQSALMFKPQTTEFQSVLNLKVEQEYLEHKYLILKEENNDLIDENDELKAILETTLEENEELLENNDDLLVEISDLKVWN